MKSALHTPPSAFAAALFAALLLAPLSPLPAAETISTDTLTVTTARRTWRIQIFADLGDPWRAEFLREEVKTLPGGTVLARAQKPTVTRDVAAVQSESVMLASGKVITAAELAEALAAFGDRWAAADAAPATPPPTGG